MTDGGWRPSVGLVSAWATPALLLAVPAALLAGRDGLWVALLFVVAPLFASLATPGDPGTARTGSRALPLILALLVVGLIAWANLSLAGDVAVWMGWPRWRGVVPATVAGLGLALWPEMSRRWPWFVPVGVVALALPVGAVVHASHSDPIATWGAVASQPGFRFPTDSPWVTRGRVVGPRPGSLALGFEEEHRLMPVDAGPLRVEVSDGGRLRVQEWTLAPGQSVTLRPGDRLQLDGPRRLKFEADKRVPGAPVSGIAWADSTARPRGSWLIRLVGLGLTLLGGAVALGRVAAPAWASRRGVALGALLLLILLVWAEIWAVYAARWAPELFVGGVSAASLVELPALALRDNPWGQGLAALALVGLFVLFLAGSAALRERLAGLEGEPGGSALASDPGLWGGVFAVAGLAAVRPVDPWSLVLAALGLGASTLAPLALVGAPAHRPRALACALGIGLALFVGLSAVGRLGLLAGSIVHPVTTYPALAAAPVTGAMLRVAGRPPRA